jgi:wyosine [tRNA(Phe)-imidazoG37] synthetase (radical SAM superfamily)
MPTDGKVCTFDCLYCEAGYNAQGPGKTGLPSRKHVRECLEAKLSAMRNNNENLDVITFSGNGEPTVHPDFAGVIADTIELRNKYFPKVKVSVLTNSTQLHRADVVEALRQVDNNILKLDSAIEETMRALDRPTSPAFSVEKVVEQLKTFGKGGIIQTMMTRCVHDGVYIDNTTDHEIAALIDAYNAIKPGEIMLYSIDRKTPEKNMVKIDAETLKKIAQKITESTGITVVTA